MAYKPTSDRTLFLTASLLMVFGLVMVYSASSVVASDRHDGNSSYFFLRQLIYAAVGYAAMIGLMNIDYHLWKNKKLILILLLANGVLLLLVFAHPTVNRAHRWLRYGSISFQPSEMTKLVLLIFMAAYLHKYEAEINRFRDRLLPCLAVIVGFAVLIAFEPDLGQAICILMIAAVLLFAAGLSWKYIGLAVATGLPALCMVVLLFDYNIQRWVAFLDRSFDPLKTTYQITQSLTALGSGGIAGLGLGASKQKHLFLPEAHSDFIFAIIGEELGLIGTSLLCLAFVIYFYRGAKIAFKAPDTFGYYLALGITLMVAMQAFINISMVMALLPTKGIALPFISQGGSSLLMNLMATGVLLNISNYAEKA